MLAKNADHELDGATSSLSLTRFLDHRVFRMPRRGRRHPVLPLQRPRGSPCLPGPPRRYVGARTPPLRPCSAVLQGTGPPS